jgi:hypothetical protein
MIIDAHVHCGIQDKFPSQSYDDYFSVIRGSGIQKAVMFPPVMEIYDRYDPYFTDSAQWKNRRKSANDYLLHIGTTELAVIPYFFIWNDFAVDQLTPQHKGIKWHRHSNEPIYHYDSPQCRRAVNEIRRRNMPVVLEEEFNNTVRFIEQIAKGVTVIIPHMGMLNGGYELIKRHGLWARPDVYVDTALASASEITDYINEYGSDRIIFGSDFPFGDPRQELLKIMHLQISREQKEIICGLNIQRLLAESNV